MKTSIEYPKTPGQVKRELKKLGISQIKAAEAIGKSPAMVSMTLSGSAKSQPILDALKALIAERSKKDGNGQSASV